MLDDNPHLPQTLLLAGIDDAGTARGDKRPDPRPRLRHHPPPEVHARLLPLAADSRAFRGRPDRRKCGQMRAATGRGRQRFRRGGSRAARFEGRRSKPWIPAFAGMTAGDAPYGGERGVCDFTGAAPPRGRPTIREPPGVQEGFASMAAGRSRTTPAGLPRLAASLDRGARGRYNARVHRRGGGILAAAGRAENQDREPGGGDE